MSCLLQKTDDVPLKNWTKRCRWSYWDLKKFWRKKK